MYFLLPLSPLDIFVAVLTGRPDGQLNNLKIYTHA